jgi:hypothetical protein
MNENVTKRLRWSFAVAMPVGAAAVYLLYMANGIAAGDMIGIAGLEQGVAAAQRYATFWLAAFWVLQAGVVVSVLSVLRFGAAAAPIARYGLRGLVAVLLSFPLTLAVGIMLFEVLSLMRPHFR